MPPPTHGPTVSPAPPPAPAPVLPVHSTHKTANDACLKRLQQLMIEPAKKLYPPVKPPSEIGRAFNVQTNLFGIEVHKRTDIHQYSIHISSNVSPSKTLVFTKKGLQDFIVLDRHKKCCEIMYHVINKYPDFFKTPDNFLIYDGQGILFTTVDLFADSMLNFKEFGIEGSNMSNTDLQRFQLITLSITKTKNPALNFSKEELGRRTADANIDVNNRVYEQILSLCLNQYCIRETKKFACFENGKIYFLDPAGAGFEPQDCVGVGDGKTMMPGLKKSIRFIEGPEGRGNNNPSIVIDAKKGTFHDVQTVDEKLNAILLKELRELLTPIEHAKCEPVIKGLDCYTLYTGRKHHFRLDYIHAIDARTGRFEWNDRTVTVAQYFEERWNIQLQKPWLNLIVSKRQGRSDYYPMELVIISKHQRVKFSQQTSLQSQKSTKESAVLPDVRQRLIMTGMNAANIGGEEVLEKLGVAVYASPLQLPARKMPDIKILFGKKESNVRDGKWRGPDHYSRPAEAPALWAMFAVGNPTSRFTQEDLNKFHIEFVNMCKSKGVDFRHATSVKMMHADQIEAALTDAADNHCQFVLVITEDSIKHLHQKYKLLERNRQMIVQDMTMSLALSVIHKNKRISLENVVNKTNVKLGGTNYLVIDPKRYIPDQLIIGIGFSAPPPGSTFVLEGKGFLNPEVIGHASNAVNPQEYTGDFLLNTVGQDTLAAIEDILKQHLELFEKSRKTMPKRVIVYRSGIAENAHGSVIAFEIPIALKTLKSIDPNMKLIYIAVTKDHTQRFFRVNDADDEDKTVSSASYSSTSSFYETPKASEMNIPPGILFDSMVTHPAAKQFYLNSHTTLQGTALTPSYTVLADETDAPMKVLEELTYALCHSHQIVNLTTSVPTPLYVANEYAKRGRNLWIEKTENSPIPCGNEDEVVRLQEITVEMSYKNAGYLIERRVNA